MGHRALCAIDTAPYSDRLAGWLGRERGSAMNTVDLTLYVHHETDAAYKVSDTGDPERAVWLPKSQLGNVRELLRDGREMIQCECPEWLADQKGLA
jgi:hypothetical protein